MLHSFKLSFLDTSMICLCILSTCHATGVRGKRDQRTLFRGKDDSTVIPPTILAAQAGKDNGKNNQDDTPPLSGMTLGQLWDMKNSSREGISPNAACPNNREYVDVVIIGAGMAGVAAASTLQAKDPALTYRVLESTDRIGGRMRSHSFGGVTVEDGANWVIEFDGNPIAKMANTMGLKATIQDFNDIAAYYQDGTPVPAADFQQANDRFMKFWDDLIVQADNQWTKNHEKYPDKGVKQALRSAGWSYRDGMLGNLDYTIEWDMLSWEYATDDTSIRYFPPTETTQRHVNDMRGFEILPQTYFQQNAKLGFLRLNTRVSKVNYNENVSWQGKVYKTMVSAKNAKTGACTDYYAQRVISTVSVGVINNNLITFNPPLVFPAQQHNPLYMAQYIKVFYKFNKQFWDNQEILRIARDPQHQGQCHQWANMNFAGMYPGSFILRCELMTEAFETLINPTTKELSETTLQSLLEPLRITYGTDTVGTPLGIYYPKLNKDADFGYGAYANWKVGKTFTDYAHFYGGIEIVPYCEHNGCNVLGEWTMMLSGSASCYNHAENTHGAFFAGEKAAKNALREMGYKGIPADTSPCDVDWVWLQ